MTDDSQGTASDGDGSVTDRSGPDREQVTLTVRSGLLETWERQAEMAKLDLDEFVERMVEAGRMSVNVQPDTDSSPAMTEEHVTDEIRSQLRREEYRSWDDLVEAITGELERHVEDALAEMQADGEVRYSGLHGGYQLVEEDER
ncbi:DUF5805 domain-containing protein [Halostella salina]|uniref:DUF5805 domain-containing protein n=1 Tax=Halostella salina TaxID=1547897 RepID=UPI000EF7D94F|nr:DUF5805 domain-containing protein [Halostella salina]